ncbi:unnamed protein product [Leuciscus chuanchicus]
MDPEKVKAVVDWPSPDSRKALQRFLGFANFYRRFIRNFSQLALTSPRTTFRWSDAAEAAFAKLKGRFVSAPILVTPDPSRQFMVEVDASEVGFAPLVRRNRPPDGLLQPLPIPSRPWSHIALDFVTALPPSQGNTVVLTVVDRFSKAVHFIPLPKLPSAQGTALTVVNHVFRLHGLPTDVVSDRGPQFVSKFWQEFCRLLGATVSLSSGFHPQSNGQTERANQDLERTLRCLVSKNPSSWGQQLSMVEYAHSSLPVSSTGLSPFECSLGYQPPIFPSLESEVAVPSAHAFVQRCHRTWTRARETLLQVGARTKARADRHRSRPPVYVVGQKVWLSTKNIPFRSVSNKLAPKFIGPFTVTKIISPVAVRLKLPPVYRRIHPAFHSCFRFRVPVQCLPGFRLVWMFTCTGSPSPLFTSTLTILSLRHQPTREPILVQGGVTYRDEPWHKECFLCSGCKVKLAGQPFTTQGADPFCVKCFSNLYTQKCDKPITGFGEGKYVSFEDRQWHQSCFKCSECSVSLVGAGFFPDGTKILCKNCNAK